MLVIDGRFLSQRKTGVQAFALDYTKYLLDTFPEDVLVITPRNARHNFVDNRVIEYGYGNGHFWTQFFLVGYVLFNLRNQRVTILSFSGLPPLFYPDVFFTIHDVSLYENPSWFSFKYVLFYKAVYKILSLKRNSILTVSEFSRQQIIKYIGVKPSKVSVIYNAIHPFNTNSSSHDSLQTPMPSNELCSYFDPDSINFVTLCTLEPRKNLNALISAIHAVNRNGCKVNLVVIGAKNKNFSSVSFRYDLTCVRFCGYLADWEVDFCMKKMDGFVYPSLYEGFGRPPIEAMFYGKPIAVSNVSSLPEVIGSQLGVYYFEPTSVDSISSCLMSLIDELETVGPLIDYGSVLKKYSMETLGECLKEVIVNHENTTSK